MKKNKVIVSFCTCALALSLGLGPVNAISIEKIPSVNLVEETRSLTSIALEFAKEVFWYYAKKGAETVFRKYEEKSVVTGGNYVQNSTGTIDFNKGDVGASIKVQANLNRSNLEIDAFAQKSSFIPDFFSHIVVTISSPSGNIITSRSVTHNQHTYVKSGSPYGKYSIMFTDEDEAAWNCYHIVTDYNLTARSQLLNRYINIYNENGDIIPSVYDSNNQITYVTPSNEAIKFKNEFFSKEKYLSANDLSDESFDAERDILVNDFKHYNIGDQLLFKDIIKKIEYNNEYNYTAISFDCKNQLVTWPFKGDLTNRFKVGQEIKFKFNVVEEFSYQDEKFENIDYAVEGKEKLKNNDYEIIDDYLD